MKIRREIAIGEVRLVEDVLVICLEDNPQVQPLGLACARCAFKDRTNLCAVYFCGGNMRKDGRNVHFEELIDKVDNLY